MARTSSGTPDHAKFLRSVRGTVLVCRRRLNLLILVMRLEYVSFSFGVASLGGGLWLMRFNELAGSGNHLNEQVFCLWEPGRFYLLRFPCTEAEGSFPPPCELSGTFVHRVLQQYQYCLRGFCWLPVQDQRFLH